MNERQFLFGLVICRFFCRYFTNYRELNCRLECILAKIERACQCLPYYYAMYSQSTRMCTFLDVKCLVDKFCRLHQRNKNRNQFLQLIFFKKKSKNWFRKWISKENISSGISFFLMQGQIRRTIAVIAWRIALMCLIRLFWMKRHWICKILPLDHSSES